MMNSFFTFHNKFDSCNKPRPHSLIFRPVLRIYTAVCMNTSSHCQSMHTDCYSYMYSIVGGSQSKSLLIAVLLDICPLFCVQYTVV